MVMSGYDSVLAAADGGRARGGLWDARERPQVAAGVGGVVRGGKGGGEGW